MRVPRSKLVKIRWNILDEALSLAQVDYGAISKRFKYSRPSISQWKKNHQIPSKVLITLCEEMKLDLNKVLIVQKDSLSSLETRRQEVIQRFLPHQVDSRGMETIKHFNQLFLQLAIEIEETCPKHKDKNHAITLLKSAQMHVNSAIACDHPLIQD